jgi:hypothetical protein
MLGSHDVRYSREPRPSRPTLSWHVSRQILAEFDSHDSRRILVNRRSTLLRYTAPTFPGSKLIPPILGTVVFFYGALVFIRGAWGELADRKPGMMTLISTGSIVAFGTSLAGTGTPTINGPRKKRLGWRQPLEPVKKELRFFQPPIQPTTYDVLYDFRVFRQSPRSCKLL